MATSQYDLTNLVSVKAWVNSVQSTSDDAVLQWLITATSRQIIRELGRTPFVSHNVETRDGNGNERIMFKKYPVSVVNAVNIRGAYPGFIPSLVPLAPNVIPPSDGLSAGYMFDDQFLTLVWYAFPIGKANIVLDYVSGLYDEVFEQTNINGSAYTVSYAATFLRNQGVSYMDGSPLQLVDANPGVGQYTVQPGWIQSPVTVNGGIYTFSAGDLGQDVVIHYRYGSIAEDLQQIANEAVGLLYSNKKHIGQIQNSIGGQRTVFLNQSLPPETICKINLIKTRVPVI